jgi:hypothetical protein
MAINRFFKVHRTWEDWLGMALGVVIALSPWIARQTDHELVTWNAVAIGAIVLVLAELELVGLRRWQEAGTIACGLWVAASPLVFGYAEGTLRYWHFALGIAVVLLALLQLWQDWKLSDRELARHGQ